MNISKTNLSKTNLGGSIRNLAGNFGAILGRNSTRGNPYHEMQAMPDWNLAVDISESDTEYLICGDIPGVNREDMQISINQGMLTVEGNRRMRPEDAGRKFNRNECNSGRFVRSFRIPDDADAESLALSCRDGMFFLTLPRFKRGGSGRIVDIYVE